MIYPFIVGLHADNYASPALLTFAADPDLYKETEECRFESARLRLDNVHVFDRLPMRILSKIKHLGIYWTTKGP